MNSLGLLFDLPSSDMLSPAFVALVVVVKHIGLLWWLVAFIIYTWMLAERTYESYLAVMHLKKIQLQFGKLTGAQKAFGYPILFKGLLRDWWLNVISTVYFGNRMAHWKELTTGRLIRYANGPDGWRKRVALWFGRDLLDQPDPDGVHIEVKK